MTYGILFNLIALVSISALLASVMVHAEDPASASPADSHQHHADPAPVPKPDSPEHLHHSHSGHAGDASATPGAAASGWAEYLKIDGTIDGTKATAIATAEKRYHDQRRAMKKRHYAELMALEKDKLESLEAVLSKKELGKLQALWIQQLREEHQQH